MARNLFVKFRSSPSLNMQGVIVPITLVVKLKFKYIAHFLPINLLSSEPIIWADISVA